MSMQNLLEGFAILDAHRSRWHFVGPPNSELISSAEEAIGFHFPPTYREFVKRFGAGGLGAFEVYGITGDNFETGKVPNGIWFTLDERRSGDLPNDLLIIADVGDGSYYCLELRNEGEGRVVIFELGVPANEQKPEVVADDFGEFFLSQIRQEV